MGSSRDTRAEPQEACGSRFEQPPHCSHSAALVTLKTRSLQQPPLSDISFPAAPPTGGRADHTCSPRVSTQNSPSRNRRSRSRLEPVGLDTLTHERRAHGSSCGPPSSPRRVGMFKHHPFLEPWLSQGISSSKKQLASFLTKFTAATRVSNTPTPQCTAWQ